MEFSQGNSMPTVEHEINLQFSNQTNGIMKIICIKEHPVCKVTQLVFHSVFPIESWNKFGLPLVDQSFCILEVSFEVQRENYFLVWKRNSQYFVHVYFDEFEWLFLMQDCSIFISNCLRLFNIFGEIPIARNQLNKNEKLNETVEFADFSESKNLIDQSYKTNDNYESKLKSNDKSNSVEQNNSYPISFKRLILEKLKKDHKEKARLILRKSQSQFQGTSQTSSVSFSCPSIENSRKLFNPTTNQRKHENNGVYQTPENPNESLQSKAEIHKGNKEICVRRSFL